MNGDPFHERDISSLIWVIRKDFSGSAAPTTRNGRFIPGNCRTAPPRRGAGARGTAATAAVAVKFKLDENLPVSCAAILARAGHDVDTVGEEGLSGAPDPEVVAAATATGRVLISLDVGLADIRAFSSGSHAGIVVLRLTDQSAAAVSKALSDLAAASAADSLAGAVAVLQRGLLRIRHP